LGRLRLALARRARFSGKRVFPVLDGAWGCGFRIVGWRREKGTGGPRGKQHRWYWRRVGREPGAAAAGCGNGKG
jgi:hypothetical protein